MYPLARFTKAHLIDKNKDLKGTYKAIRDAMRESDAGLDSTTAMVIGGPNVWEKIRVNHKKVVKFGKKRFPHYSSCEMLYEEHREVTRTGQEASEAQTAPPRTVPTSVGGVDAFAANIGASSVAMGAFAASSAAVGAFAASSAAMSASCPANIGGQEVIEAQSAPSGSSAQGDGKKRKQNKVALVLDDYLDHKKKNSKQAIEAMMQKKSRADEHTVEKCLDTVSAMDELTDVEKAPAAEVLESEMNREMFMMQKNLNVRLIWLWRKLSIPETSQSTIGSSAT